MKVQWGDCEIQSRREVWAKMILSVHYRKLTFLFWGSFCHTCLNIRFHCWWQYVFDILLWKSYQIYILIKMSIWMKCLWYWTLKNLKIVVASVSISSVTLAMHLSSFYMTTDIFFFIRQSHCTSFNKGEHEGSIP